MAGRSSGWREHRALQGAVRSGGSASVRPRGVGAPSDDVSGLGHLHVGKQGCDLGGLLHGEDVPSRGCGACPTSSI